MRRSARILKKSLLRGKLSQQLQHPIRGQRSQILNQIGSVDGSGNAVASSQMTVQSQSHNNAVPSRKRKQRQSKDLLSTAAAAAVVVATKKCKLDSTQCRTDCEYETSPFGLHLPRCGWMAMNANPKESKQQQQLGNATVTSQSKKAKKKRQQQAMYLLYHDTEWGRPSYDESHLFEHLVLANMQCGLSWNTIMMKRPAFRSAFHGFNIAKVASFTEEDVERLVNDATILRHRRKIQAAINNAKVVLKIVKEHGSFREYLWSFLPECKPVCTNLHNTCTVSGEYQPLPTQTELSTRLSKDLKKRGCSFVGPVTMQAFMQSVGVLNAHAAGCFVHQDIQQQQDLLVAPEPTVS
jgi:DNA-3-methyladenine glycosylase I